MEEIQEPQISNNLNDLCIQLPDPSHRGDVIEPAEIKVSTEEAVSDGEHNKMHVYLNLSVPPPTSQKQGSR